MRLKNTIIVIAFCIAMLNTLEARAWECYSCDGQIHAGMQDNETWKPDRCSLPVGGARDQAFEYARGEWNKIDGVSDRHGLGTGDSDCSINNWDGDYEIGYAAPSHSWLDGDPGVTRSRWYPCFPPYIGELTDGEMIESDIIISTDLNLSAESEVSTSLGARETIIHELGHTLGMNHENDVPSVMCSTDTCGKVAERSATGAYGGHTETIWPDDVRFLAEYHGTSSEGLPDLAVTAFRWSSFYDRMERNYSNYAYIVCPGWDLDLYFGFINKGKKNSPNSDVMVVVSSDETISKDDHVVWTGTWNNPYSGAYLWAPIEIIVPDISPGIYHIGFIVDPDNEIVEEDEYNNSGRLYARIDIQWWCD